MSDTVTTPPAPAQEAEKRDPKAKIPGLELTWEEAEFLKISDDGIQALVKLKQANPQSRLSLIPLRDERIFIARNCSRTEWRSVVSDLASADPEKTKVANDPNLTPGAVEQQLNMLAEDRLVARFIVHPQLSILQVRDMDPGDVKCLHDSIMLGLGYAQQPRAIKL